MPAKYKLQPDEAVILREQSVCHGGTFASYTDELILTNQNLVLVKKGVFGNSKGIRVFPIDQIKVFNDQAQARFGKRQNGAAALEVYFVNGEETFAFQGGSTKTLLNWVSKINLVVTGTESVPDGTELSGAEGVADMLRDTFGAFKSRLETRLETKPEPTAAAPAIVASKCTGCGAPLSGTSGTASTCDYCGTVQQL